MESESDLGAIGDLDSFDLERALSLYIPSSNTGVLNGLKGGTDALCTHVLFLCSPSLLHNTHTHTHPHTHSHLYIRNNFLKKPLGHILMLPQEIR